MPSLRDSRRSVQALPARYQMNPSPAPLLSCNDSFFLLLTAYISCSHIRRIGGVWRGFLVALDDGTRRTRITDGLHIKVLHRETLFSFLLADLVGSDPGLHYGRTLPKRPRER